MISLLIYISFGSCTCLWDDCVNFVRSTCWI